MLDRQRSLWAEVCVNTPLGRVVGPSLGADRDRDPDARTFTYRVPDRLADRIQPGHLVWVPFRSRRLQAVVLELVTREPQFETLEIEAFVWAQPVLTQVQLELARWISGYYLAPFIEALRLMLPAHITQRGRTVFVRTREPEPAGLTPTQSALLEQIATEEGTWPEISQGLKVTQKADLEPLIEQGLVAREVAFANPPPRPKVNRRVRLLASREEIDRLLPTLGHTSVQADVLNWLAAQDDPVPALADLCKALGVTPASIKGMAERGLVNVPPPKTLVRRTIPDVDLPKALATFGRSPKQSAALAALPCELIDESEYRSAQQVDASTLRALERRGLIDRIVEPALVSLALDRAGVPEAIIRLRGAEKHRRVLQALLRHEGPPWIGWVYAETDANLDTLRDLESAGLITLEEEVIWRDPLAGQEFQPDRPPVLTPDQEHAWAQVMQGINAAHALGQRPEVAATQGPSANAPAFLLYGVTGSGKTEIYLRGIAEVLTRGRQAIVLVPEIALTPQTVQRFAARFPGQVAVWHSGLSEGERFDMWRRVRTDHPAAQVVVGSRSALFLPFPDLGLIVVDEEHESSYKQERTPRYHARRVALELGPIAGAPVLLGSATPALESYYAARMGQIRLVTLPRRILRQSAAPDEQVLAPELPYAPERPGASSSARRQRAAGPSVQGADMPHVEIVDMRQELRAGNRSMFSRPLSVGLHQVLEQKQQAILYMNRRGSASFVMCRDCGHVEACPRCTVPLTYHGTGNVLICHHCNRRYPVPMTCPECGSRRIRYFGSGTQNVEEAVKQAFPGARTLRWDRDVTGRKGSHDAILSHFSSHQADILIGTQMIAKGLDLPLVTLVGVVAADTGLFLPDFRAGERTFQLLTQVAGRAGRSALGGKVIIQTYHPDHYAILAAGHHDFESFYRQEMTFRRQQGYPPLRRLARLIFEHGQRAQAQAEATRVAGLLTEEIAALELEDMELIGPAPCYFGQQRGQYRWQIVVRAADPTVLLRRVRLDVGWRVDVDPTDLL